MKKIIFFLVLTLFIFANCKGEPKTAYKEKINTRISYNDTIQGIKTLKEFYLKV